MLGTPEQEVQRSKTYRKSFVVKEQDHCERLQQPLQHLRARALNMLKSSRN